MATVKLYASLRSITRQTEINVPGTNLQDVLEKLTGDHPEMEPFLFEKGKLRPRVIISLNGHPLDPQAILQTRLSAEDQVAIFPPVAGG